jgi:hypothetical protein
MEHGTYEQMLHVRRCGCAKRTWREFRRDTLQSFRLVDKVRGYGQGQGKFMKKAQPATGTLETASHDAGPERIVFHIGVFLVCFLILYSRRPDAILDAQFYAEDGARWYRDAYQLGWRCLLVPETGYLQTVSRLIGLFAQIFPLVLAPLVMNLCALGVQILPVNLLLSRRFDPMPMVLRFIGCLLYLGIPNSIEIHANTTNIQWHLGLICVLMMLGGAPSERWRVAGDVLLLVLLSLDSPLGWLLIPVAAILWWKKREKRAVIYLAAVIPGALIQAMVLLLSQAHGREAAVVGANLTRLAGILGGQVFLSAVLGVRTLAHLFLLGNPSLLFCLQVLAMCVGIALTFFGVRYAPFQMRLFFLFAAGVLVLALSRPVAGPDVHFPQWQYLQIPGRSSRYYFFPILAFYAVLFSLVTLGKPGTARVVRYVALAVLLAVPFGVYRDWKYPRYPDLHFREYADRFERAQPGTSITIPILPPGWQMDLVKH